ncbi:MAG TPA: HEAT repeat domain-containing protein, partial [Humisphaera sp.]
MRLMIRALLALAVVALAPCAAHAYIAVSAERLTLPEVILEFKAVAAVTVDRSDPNRGAVRYRVTEELAGKWPAAASLKHVLTLDGKPPPDLGTPRQGEAAVLFWGSFDNRSLVLTARGWYQTRSPGAGDDGWERLTQLRADMGRVFAGPPDELIVAIRRLRQAEPVTAAVRLKGGDPRDRVYVTYDPLDPHRRLPPRVQQQARAADRKVDAAATAATAKGLSAKDPAVRQRAAVALADGPSAAAAAGLPALLAAAAKDPELEVRATALEAVGVAAAGAKPIDPAVIDVLSAAARDDDRFVAAAAARALARLGPASASAAAPATRVPYPSGRSSFR